MKKENDNSGSSNYHKLLLLTFINNALAVI